MSGALLYLAGVSIRNRLASQLARLRRPRYVLAVLLGIAYLWFFLMRPDLPASHTTPALFWASVETLGAIGVLLLLISPWVFASENSALAFTPAEVQFLFPGPVTRRELIEYKMLRVQVVILFNAVIWVFLLRRGGSALPGALRFIGAWLLFANVSLHRLGAALVRASLAQHGKSGVRRQWPAIALGLTILAALVGVVIVAIPALRAASGAAALGHALQAAMSTPFATVLLYVPRVIVGPLFAQTQGAWLRAMGPAVALALLQAWWVVRTDSAFEDAAVRASAERARRMEARRRRAARAAPRTRLGGAPAGRRTLPLSPVGPPAGAIVWKNTLLLMRTLRVAPVLGIAAMAFFVSLPAMEGRGLNAHFVAMASLAMALLLLVLGSRVLSNDLRQDVEHLEILKVLPLRGRTLVAAEVLSSALPIALLQLVLVAVAYAALLGDVWIGSTPATRTLLLLLAPAVLLALNATTVTIQNGAALLFPGWVRIGPNVSGGVEAMGQGILATLVLLLTFVVALVPAGLGFGAIFWALWPGTPYAWVPALLAATGVLLAEAWLVVRGLGRRFEAMEPREIS